MPNIIIPLVPSKTKRRVQVLNDALPGVILLGVGLSALLNQGITRTNMPYLSVIVGIVVIRFAVEEFRSERHPRKFNWFDISAGFVILIDAVNQYKSYKGFQAAHLYFLVGIGTIVRGFYAEKIPLLRRVTLSDDRIVARTAIFRGISSRWDGVLRVDCLTTSIVFILEGRKKRLNLRRFENRAEIIEKIASAAKEHSVEVMNVR